MARSEFGDFVWDADLSLGFVRILGKFRKECRLGFVLGQFIAIESVKLRMAEVMLIVLDLGESLPICCGNL